MKNENHVRILTDVEEPRVRNPWHQRTDVRTELFEGRGIISTIIRAVRLLWLSRRYDIVIIGGSRVAFLFAIFSGLWPRRKTPVLMIDCLWYRPRTRLMLWLKRLQFRLTARSVKKFVVWASHEVRDYATTFSIPEEKFLYIPHHHTLESYSFEVTRGDYIFSGGDGDRDYSTLLRAVQGLDVKVIIATRRSEWHGNLSVPSEAKVFPTSPQDFRKWMAGSMMVAIPMQKGLLHSGGQQTYLNAMAMGKPVIVADDGGAADYIEHGFNGLTVPAGDVEALKAAIKSVIEDAEFATKLANNAREVYDTHSTRVCLQRILNVAEAIITEAKELP